MVLLIRVPLAVAKGTVMATGKLRFAAYVPVAVSVDCAAFVTATPPTVQVFAASADPS